MKNKSLTNSHLIISTDLEPDDILGLLTLFSELKKQFIETRSYPSIQFLVGESSVSKKEKMEEIVAAAVADGLMTQEQVNKIEVLNGFSSRGDDDFAHQFYTENFLKTDARVSDEEVMASRNRIVEKTAQIKAEGKNVVIFAWKPITDLMALNDALNLNTQDQIYLSGSYNIRQIIDWKAEESVKLASCNSINDFLKNVKAELSVFEAFPTYEKSKLPKSIANYHSSDPIKSALGKISNVIQTSSMSTVQILKDAVTVWNKGIIMGQTGKIFEILKESYPEHTANLSAVENAFNQAYEAGKSISELDSILKNGLGEIFGENVLKGTEKSPDDFDKSLKINKMDSFSRKWKIINSITSDPFSMIIGDATTIVHAFNSDTYAVTKAGIEYDPKNGYSKIVDGGDAQILTGVKDYDLLLTTLADATGTQLGLDSKKSRTM